MRVQRLPRVLRYLAAPARGLLEYLVCRRLPPALRRRLHRAYLHWANAHKKPGTEAGS